MLETPLPRSMTHPLPTLPYDSDRQLRLPCLGPAKGPDPSPPTAINGPEATSTEVTPTNRHRWLLDQVSALLCCCTPDGRITYVNQAYCQFFQRSASELLGQPIWTLFPASVQSRCQGAISRWRRYANTNGPTPSSPPVPYTDRVAMRDANQVERWVVWTYQLLLPPAEPGPGERPDPVEILIQGQALSTAQAMLPSQSLPADQSAQSEIAAILNHAGVSVASFRLYPDRSWHYDYFSQGCAAVFGYTAGEFAADTNLWWSRIDPDDWEQVILPAQERLLQGQEARTRYRFRHKDGQMRWIESVLTAQYDAAANCWRIIAIDSDITPLKQTEVQLRQNEANLLALVENIDGSIWAIDRQYALIIGNTRFQQNTERALGHTFQPGDCVLPPEVPPDIRVEWQGYYDRALAGEQFSLEIQTQLTPTPRWVDYRFNPIRAANGDILGVTIFGQDVSERRRAKEQLQAQADRLREVQRIGRIGSWEYDFVQQCATWSEELLAIVGWDRQQRVPGYRDLLARVHPDDRLMYQTLLEQTRETGGSYNTDLRILSPDGTLKYIAVHGEAMVNAQGQVTRLLGTAVDVTERKQAELALWQRAERDRLVKTITQNIHQSLDLPHILATTVNDVLRVLQTDRALIFRLYPSGAGSVIQIATTPDYPLNEILHWQDACFRDRHQIFYRQGQPRPINDVRQDEWRDCQANLMTQLGVKSKLVAPILARNEAEPVTLWGLLIIHACAQPRVWQSVEIDLLQQIADQLAIAIQQAELYNQVRQFNADLEHQVQVRTAELRDAFEFEATLKRISDHVRDSLDEEQILQTAVQELVHALGVSGCNASQYDLEQGIAVVNYEYTHLSRSYKNRMIQLAERPEIYEPLLQLRSLQFCPVPPDPELGQLLMLVVPIQDNQTSLGDLWLLDTRPGRQFSEQQIRLVEQVANQCAIALRQSRLYHAAQMQVTELERLNRLKDDFLSTVSHELRTPMTNIIMATQVLEMLLERANFAAPDAERVDRYFQILASECRREMNLVNDLLEFSRLETAHEPLEFTPVDLGEWLPQLIQPFEERVRKQHQSLRLDLAADLPPVNTHIPSLERILTELLNNACKYTPAGETITISSQQLASPPTSPTAPRAMPHAQDTTSPVVQTASPPVQRMQVTICNSGVEIPLAEQERIFERFYRIPNHDPWKYGGTGLGLALVKKMTARIQGEIRVESHNLHTCFCLTLPLYP